MLLQEIKMLDMILFYFIALCKVIKIEIIILRELYEFLFMLIKIFKDKMFSRC